MLINSCGCSNCNSVMPLGLTPEQRAARKVVSRKLPTFSGNPDEWLFFVSTYEQSTQICGLTDAENLIRLRECLTGEALKNVKSQLQYPKDVAGTIEVLRLLYGTPDLIINSVLRRLRKEQSPTLDKRHSMVRFAVLVQELCVAMTNANMTDTLNHSILLQELEGKLPEVVEYDWKKQKSTLPTNATLHHFAAWIFDIAKARNTELLEFKQTEKRTEKSSQNSNKSSNKGRGFVYTHSPKEESKSSSTSKKCVVCGGSCDHIERCQKFKDMSNKDKWSTLRDNNLCRCCLSKHGPYCKAIKNSKCGVKGCNLKHHPLLHRTEDNHSANSTTVSNSSSATNSTTVSNSSSATNSTANKPNTPPTTTTSDILTHRAKYESILFRYIPVILYNENVEVRTHAFIDDGSSLTLIEKETADKLKLKGVPEPLCLKWTGNTCRMEEDSRKVSFNISNTMNPARQFNICNVKTVSSLNLPHQSLDLNQFQESYKHLNGIPAESYHNITPTILIGIDNLNLTSPLNCREGAIGDPIAVKSRLGWSICGPVNKLLNNNINGSFHICECKQDEKLDQLMKDFFAAESIGLAQPKMLDSEDDKRAKDILEKKTIRIDDRFECRLLWKNDFVSLPDSLPAAERRHKCLMNKMNNNPELATVLNAKIEEYHRKGYIRKLTPEEASQTVPHTWYLPIFPVFNPNKPGKVRLVWDAASMVRGVSLNSCLLKGPDNLVPLQSVLLKFREKRIAICADIEEMFLRIQINQEDQPAQRFLWQEPGESKPSVYVMQVMTFGSTSSPCTAQFVKNKNAMEFVDRHPRAVRSIIENHYVDDLLDCTDTVEEAIQLAWEIKMIHMAGGFNIRNWISNSKEVIEALDEKPTEKKTTINFDITTEKVLGLTWNTEADAFQF